MACALCQKVRKPLPKAMQEWLARHDQRRQLKRQEAQRPPRPLTIPQDTQ